MHSLSSCITTTTTTLWAILHPCVFVRFCLFKQKRELRKTLYLFAKCLQNFISVAVLILCTFVSFLRQLVCLFPFVSMFEVEFAISLFISFSFPLFVPVNCAIMSALKDGQMKRTDEIEMFSFFTAAVAVAVARPNPLSVVRRLLFIRLLRLQFGSLKP